MILKLKEKKEATAGVLTFIFEPQEKLEWVPGQYLHYVLHHEPTDNRGSDRWFTNAAAPYENHVQITTRITQDKGSSFKKKLASLKEGDEIEISYVEGDFTLDNPDLEYVFIAGGIGITPFRSILRQLDHDKKPINVNLIYANRDQNVVFRDELEELSTRNPNLKINYVFSPEHIDENKVKELVPDFNPPAGGPIFYVSGPEPMVDSLNEMLEKMGIPKEHIKGDWFPGYPAE
ncbi:MAG TPA: FAD-dependent oxidoreductase [Patescibacteria group bacterium]|nr:FAD-dependent oxidoreductase [Patescibacteria group bacterium]